MFFYLEIAFGFSRIVWSPKGYVFVTPLLGNGRADEVSYNPLDKLRCEVYSDSAAEILWSNSTDGVAVDGQSAGGTSHFMGSGDFSQRRTFRVTVNGASAGNVICD